MIEQLIEKYQAAIKTNSKEIRLSTVEVGLLITDITKMMSTDMDDLAKDVKELKEILSAITIEKDGGSYK